MGDSGRMLEAEAVLETSLAIRGAVASSTDALFLKASDMLGVVKQRLTSYTEAEPLLRRAAEGRRSVLGNAHGDTLVSKIRLANLLSEMSREQEAAAYALEVYRENPGANDETTLNAAAVSCNVLQTLDGRLEEAQALGLHALRGRMAQRGLTPER